MQLYKFTPVAGAILATLLSACGGKGDDSPPPAPIPKIKVSEITLDKTTPRAIAQSPVKFDGGVCSGGNDKLTASWDFGDATPTSNTGTHTYATDGVKTVKVTCTDTAGSAAKVTTLDITVESVAVNGFLGKTWSAYTAIDTAHPSLYPVAGLTESGDVIGVWLGRLNGAMEVASGTTKLSSDKWTISGILATGTDKSPFDDTVAGGNTAPIDLAVSPNGHATAAWMAGSSIWYATRNGLGGTWSTPVKIDVPVLNESIKVVVNDAGEGAIAYCTSSGAHVVTYASQTTQAPVPISKQCGVLDSTYGYQRHRAFDIAVDAASFKLFAAGITDATTSGKSVVSLKTYTPGSGWSGATAMSNELDTAPASLSFSRSPNGTYAAIAWNQLHAAAPHKSNVYARVFAKGELGDIKAVQTEYTTKDYTRPMLAVNDSGDVFLAMHLNGNSIEASSYNAASATAAWTYPYSLASSYQYSYTAFNATDVAIDKWGTALVTLSNSGASTQAGTFSKAGVWSGFWPIGSVYPYPQGLHYQTLRALPDGRAILVTSVYDDKTPITASTSPTASGYQLLK